jgi:hypothetical protein
MLRKLFIFSWLIVVCSCKHGALEGTENGACYPNQTCNAGLICSNGVCAGLTADAGRKGDADLGPAGLFSFFVTSLRALQELSGSQLGFGGDLRFGETGPGAGLRGADKICRSIAEKRLPGAGTKTWHAFLSVAADENGKQVDAIDRIGNGPWYDRMGRLLARTKADLMSDRPQNGDATIRDDFPNEDGIPNHRPDVTQPSVDNHDMLTGTNAQGKLYSVTATCKDWTSALGDIATEGRPRVGHSWPRGGMGPGTGDDGGTPQPPFGDGGMPHPPVGDGGTPHPSFSDSGMPQPPFGDGGGPAAACNGKADGDPCSYSMMGMPVSGFCTRSAGGQLSCQFGGAADGGKPMPSSREGGGVASQNMANWMSSLDESGCAPGINLSESSVPGMGVCVGCGGGYGGLYCFAVTP